MVTPERMCRICRTKNDKKNLVRIVKEKNGNVFVDINQKANGRGMYLCKKEDCINKAIKSKVISRAFNCEVDNEIYNIIGNCYEYKQN